MSFTELKGETRVVLWLYVSILEKWPLLLTLLPHQAVWSRGWYQGVSSACRSDPIRMSSLAPPSRPDVVTSGSKKTTMVTAIMPNFSLQNIHMELLSLHSWFTLGWVEPQMSVQTFVTIYPTVVQITLKNKVEQTQYTDIITHWFAIFQIHFLNQSMD